MPLILASCIVDATPPAPYKFTEISELCFITHRLDVQKHTKPDWGLLMEDGGGLSFPQLSSIGNVTCGGKTDVAPIFVVFRWKNSTPKEVLGKL